ncbi:serine-rich adhesin for platelets-like [Anneissia japonica]|uniref:serine-rich adhesin for platelets-like n=1 Tax=Anneissia japonica TaxID=1529436 RepID=UPI0014255C13|nr:serine-rich adhesin for platelets-like [Anneissia japonica]
MESTEIENHQENEVCDNRVAEQAENVESLMKGEFLLPIENINTGNEAERKRRVHNEVEQRRKCKINSGIDKLGHVIPACIQDKKSKTQIVELALEYILELKDKYHKVLLEGAEKSRVEELERLRKENSRLIDENRRMSSMVNNIKVNSNGIQEIKSRSKKSRNSQKQVFVKPVEPITDFSDDLAKLNLEMEQILANQEITLEPTPTTNQNVTSNLLEQLSQPVTNQDLGLITAQNLSHPSNIVQNQQTLNSTDNGGSALGNEILLNTSTTSSTAPIVNSNMIQVKPEESKINNQGQMLLLNNPKLTQTGGTQPVTLQVANVNSPSSAGGQSIQILQPGNQIQLQSGIQNQGVAVSGNKPIPQIQLTRGNNASIKQTNATTTSIQLPGNQNILLTNQVVDQSKTQVKNVIQNPQPVTIPHNLNRTAVVQQPTPGQPSTPGNPVMQPMQPIRLIVPIMTTATGQASMTQQLTFRLPNGQTQTFPLRIIPASTGASSTTQATTTTHTNNLMPLAPAQTPPTQNTSGMVRIQPAPPATATTLPEIKPPNVKKKKSGKIKTLTDSTAAVVQQAPTFTAAGNQRIVRLQAPIQIGQKNPSGAQNLVYLQQSGQLIPIYLPANTTPGQNVQNIIANQTGVITTGNTQGSPQIGTSQSGPIQLTTMAQQGNQSSFNSCQPQQLNASQTQIVSTSSNQQITLVSQGKETILNNCNTTIIPSTAGQPQSHSGSTLLQTSDQPDALASIMASSEISDQDSGIESQDLQKSHKSLALPRTDVTNAPLSPLSVLTAELGINETESHSGGEKSNDVDSSSQDILAKAAASIFSPGPLDVVDGEQDGNSIIQLQTEDKNIMPQESCSSMNSNSVEDQRPLLMESQSSWMSSEVDQSEPSEKNIVPSKSTESTVKIKRKESRKKQKIKRMNSTVSEETNPQQNISEAGLAQDLIQMADMPSEIQTQSDLRSEDNQNYQQPLIVSHSQSSASRYSAEALLSGMVSESSAAHQTETSSMSSTSSTPSNSSFPSYTGSNNFVNDILSNSMSASGLPTYINEDEQNQQTSLFSPYKPSNKASLDNRHEEFISSRSVKGKSKSPPSRSTSFNSPVQGMTTSDLLNIADSVSDTQSQSSVLQGHQENILPEFLSPSNSESSLVSEQEAKLVSTPTPSSVAQTKLPSSWISHHSRASELASVTQQARSQTNNQPLNTPFSTTTTTVTSQSPTSRPSFFSQPWLTTTSTSSTTSTLAFTQSVFSSPVSSTARSSPNLTSPQQQLTIVNNGSVITHSTKVTGSPSRQAKVPESKISPAPRVFTKETIHRTLTMDIVEEQTQEVPKPKKHHTLPISVPDRPIISAVPDRPSVPTSVKPKAKSSRRKKKATTEKNPPVEPPSPNVNESLANVGKRALDKDLVDKFPWLADGESANGSQENEVHEQSLKVNTAQTSKNVTSFSVQTLSQSSNVKGDKSLKDNHSSKKDMSKQIEAVSKSTAAKEKESDQNAESDKAHFWNPTSRLAMLNTQESVTVSSENVSRSHPSNQKPINEPTYSSTSSVITSNHTTYPRYTSHQRTSSSYTPVEVSRPSFSDSMTTSSLHNCNTLQSTENNSNTSTYDPFSTLPQSFSGGNTCSSNQEAVDSLPDPDMDFLSPTPEPAPMFQTSSNRRMTKQPKEISNSLQSQTSVAQHGIEQSQSKQPSVVTQNCMQQSRDFSCVKSPTQSQQTTSFSEHIQSTVLSFQPSVSKSSESSRADFTYTQQNKLPSTSKTDYSLQNDDHTDIFDPNALDFPSLHDSPPQENSSRASSSVSSSHMFQTHTDSQQMRIDTPRFDNYQHRTSESISSMDRESSMNLSQTNQGFYSRQSSLNNQVSHSNLKRPASDQHSDQISAKRHPRVETSSVNQGTRNHMGVPTPDSLPRTPLSVEGHVSQQETGRLSTATSNANVAHQRHHSDRNTPNYNNPAENFSQPSRTLETGHISSRNRKRNNQAQYYPTSQTHRSESTLSHDHSHDMWHSLASQRNPGAMAETSPFLPNFSASQPSHSTLLSHGDLASTSSSTSSSISPSRRVRNPEHPTYLPAHLPSTLLSNQPNKVSRDTDIGHFNPMFAPRAPSLSMNPLQHNFPIFPDHHAPSFNVAKGPQIPSNMSLSTHPHISPNFSFNSIFGDTGSNGHVDASSLNPGLHVPHLHSNAGIPVEEHLSLRGHHIPSRHAQTFGGNPVGLNSLMRPNVPPDVRPSYKVAMSMHAQPHFHGASFGSIPPY